MEKGGADDPGTGLPIGETEVDVYAETYEYTEMYPGFGQQGKKDLMKSPNGLKRW